jgi:ComF family protein
LNSCANFARTLFTQDCLLCGAPAGLEPLCPPCRQDLPWHDAPSCPVCALPTSGGETCGACLKRAPAFSRTLAGFDYAFPLDALLHAFKYGSRLDVLDVLAPPLARRVGLAPPPDMLVAMPLHPARLRQRGFNQSHELAKALSRLHGIPLATEICLRVRDTTPQASLAWKERAGNIRGAFACHGNVSGKRIAVVDDVMTTGASLDELARTLRRAGAADVEAWVVARTLEKHHF